MPPEKEKQRYCNCCYEDDPVFCDGCGKDLKDNEPMWCSSDQKHYCNEDCQPILTEAILVVKK